MAAAELLITAQTPGSYLREQRAAGGLDLEDLGSILRSTLGLPGLADRLLTIVPQLEADQARATSIDLMALRLAFDFRPAIYRQLCADAAGPMPTTITERSL